MQKVQQFVLMPTLLAFAVLCTPGAACAAGFNQFVGLGDSTIDTGYFRYNLSGFSQLDNALPAAIAQGATGGWAGNGVMGMTILGDKFGISAGPVGDGNGGTNYANGAGYTDVAGPMPGSVSATQQIRNYLASVNGVANPHALYVVSSGNNDLLQYQSYPANFLNNSAWDLAANVATLQTAGARTILVPNSFLYAVYAQNGGGMNPSNADAYALSVSYNLSRWSNLTAAGVHYIPADLDSVFRFVVQNPTRFGFTPNSVLASSAEFYPGAPNNPAILDIVTPPRQQTDLFIDGHHLTTAGQTIEADYEYSLLVAPSQISLLAETAVQAGWAHAATIQGQLDPGGRQCRPCGRNFWTSAGVYGMETNNSLGFAGESGTPFGGTVGLDYQTENGLIFGAAFTSGSQVPGFSTGGHFSQVDEAPSLYAAYIGGPVWGSAIVSYDLFQYDIFRPVQLGLFTDENFATTTGQSLELALRGGWNFSAGRFINGPVAGLMLQQAHINSFTETGDSGVTALSFGDQTRDSLVTQLGWRVLMDGGRLRPFAEMNWNHECAGKDRTITTSLTSVGAPSYTMDAVPVVSDWATSSLGAFYEINSRIMLRGAASAMYINPQMTTCGGEFGLNIGF